MPALPQQVERDLKEIEEYEKQLAASQNPPAAEPTTTTTEAPVAPAAAPATETTPAAPAVIPSTPDWEQKYKTLQGMFDSQVPQLHAQVKALTAKLEALQSVAPAQQPPASTPAPEKLVTDKDVTEFGEPLLDVQRRIAREVMREHVAPLQDELKKRDEQIARLMQAQQRTDGAVTAMSFEQQLAIAVPDFPQINVDPKWIAYLDEKDPYTGEPRRVFAEAVYRNGNVEKVKQVVSHFKSMQTPATVPTSEETERAQRQAELERQITPTRTNSAPSTATNATTAVYTEAQMVAGFDKVRKLNALGQYEDAAKLETELSNAYIEGRVRG